MANIFANFDFRPEWEHSYFTDPIQNNGNFLPARVSFFRKFFRKNSALALFASLIYLISIPDPATAEGFTFRSQLGCFIVTLPVEPTMYKDLIPSPVGDIDQYTYYVEEYGYVLSVTFLTIPTAMGRGPQSQQEVLSLLAATRDGMLHDINAILLHDDLAYVQGHDALDFWAEDSAGMYSIRGRTILADRTSYSIMIIYPIESNMPAAGETAISSFQIGQCG